MRTGIRFDQKDGKIVMKVGDLIRIKSPFIHEPAVVTASHLFDEILLVTEIDDCGMSEINPIIVCISVSGTHRFPSEDMEVISEGR